MAQSSVLQASGFSTQYPSPPSVHWAVLLAAVAGTEALVMWLAPHPLRYFLSNIVIAAWPIYLCIWIRKIDQRSESLYWALASFATGFLFSWLLWFVAIFEIREELLEHYNRRERIGLHLNFVMTLLFSFFYFQSQLYGIAKSKNQQAERIVENAGSTLVS
jgi:hypothetical protein